MSTRKEKIRIAGEVLPELLRAYEKCDLCVRRCGVNRQKNEKGYCAAGARPIVYRYGTHHGEEPPLSGSNGSGTIFFSNCNMGCVYCQNHQFSQAGAGKELSVRRLSAVMLELQDKGCHNINLVSPTHFVPDIVKALKQAFSKGLELPIVYNTGGYDSIHMIRLLEGIVDIYLPDMRYSSDTMAEKYSGTPGYVSNNRALVRVMNGQVGNMEVQDGIARKGLIIRLLMLPEDISGTCETLEFVAGELGRETSLSVMGQYYPAYMAKVYEELNRRVTDKEYSVVMRKMRQLGLTNGWVQPFGERFDEDLAGERFLSNV